MDLKSLATQLELFHAIFDKSCDAIIIVDSEMIIRYWSESTTELLGHAKNAMLNQNACDVLIPQENRERALLAFRAYQETGKSDLLRQVHEIQISRASGELVWADLSLSEVAMRGERWLMIIARDAESRKVRENQLEREASTDHLSGLANRSSFQNELESAIGTPIALAILDVDLFKSVNDTHGHPIGDDAIRHMATQLNREFADAKCIARMGGDEFGLILPDTAMGELELRFDQFLKNLSDAKFSRFELSITASVGIAISNERSIARSLLTNADKALYLSKQSGRNRATVVQDQEVA